MERELRDCRHVAPRVDNRAIHHAVVVVENAQVDELARDPFEIVWRVVGSNACEDEQSRADSTDGFTRDRNARLAHALHERPHNAAHTRVTARESPCARPARGGPVRTSAW